MEGFRKYGISWIQIGSPNDGRSITKEDAKEMLNGGGILFVTHSTGTKKSLLHSGISSRMNLAG